MQPASFVRTPTPDGHAVINLANVSAILIDENGSFGVRRRVTVHLLGAPPLDFPEEYGDRLLAALAESGLPVEVRREG